MLRLGWIFGLKRNHFCVLVSNDRVIMYNLCSHLSANHFEMAMETETHHCGTLIGHFRIKNRNS